MRKPDTQIWAGCIAHVRRHHPGVSRQWFEQLEVNAVDGGVLTVQVIQPVRLRYLQAECTEIFKEAVQAVSGRLMTVRFISPNELAFGDEPQTLSSSTLTSPVFPTTPIDHFNPVLPQDTEPAQEDTTTNSGGTSSAHTNDLSPTTHPPANLPHGRSAPTNNRADNHAGATDGGHQNVPPVNSDDASNARAGNGGAGGNTVWGMLYDDMVINPDYSFENFVQGPNNRLAFAAAQAVAADPGRAYNPFFVYGGVGLGKTHLLQAICQTMLEAFHGVNIYYVSCEGFASQMMEAVQAGQMAEFRYRFRHIDVLVIDDIHFLGGHEQTQEEFFHTFNALYQMQKQIVLSSDAAPQEIPDIEERLLSRFKSGLVAKLEKPTYETRLYILKTKARLRNIDIPEDVICYLANQVDNNIRELEGALVQVQGHAMATEAKIDLELAREAIGDRQMSRNTRITIQDIIAIVSRRFEVKQADLLSKKRAKSIALPRQVAMFLARKHTDHSLQEIGGFFGGRDHTTVMHGINKITTIITTDDRLARQITAIEDELISTLDF